MDILSICWKYLRPTNSEPKKPLVGMNFSNAMITPNIGRIWKITRNAMTGKSIRWYWYAYFWLRNCGPSFMKRGRVVPAPSDREVNVNQLRASTHA